MEVKELIPRRALASIGMVLLVASMGLVSAYIYTQQTLYVTQTIKNKPYYYVNQLSNVDSLVDHGTHSNFTAQRYGPDSSFDNLTEENLGEAQVIEDYVDNNLSNVDSNGNKGTESNFTAQQYGPDNISDTLTEQNTGVAIAKVGTDTSGTGNSLTLSFSHTLAAGSNRLVVVYAQAENVGSIDISGITYGGTAMTKAIDGVTTSSGYYMLVEIWYLLEASLGSTGSKTVSITYSGIASSLEVNGFCAEYTNVKQAVPEATDTDGSALSTTVTNNVSPSTGAWVLSAVGCGQMGGSYTHSSPQAGVLDYTDASSQFAVAELRGGNGETSESSTWSGSLFNRQHRVCASWAKANNHELDLEVQFSNVIHFLPTEELCIYARTTGAEDIQVDVWNTTTTTWDNIFPDLNANSWNNASVSKWLTSSTFTIRFKGGNEVGDTTQDQWQIDASLLRVGGAGSAEDAVDNDTSNVDGSADVGTLSNFDNMKTKDGGMATLTEGAVGGGETVWLWQEDTSGYTSTSSFETYQFWSSWTTNSTTSGTITKIGIYVFANPLNSPQVKLGIYDDSGDNPNNLLGETNAATITGAGWLDLEIVGGGVNIYPSTTYHVSHITDIAPTIQWRYLKTAAPVSNFRNGRVWSNLFNPAGATTKSASSRYGAYRIGYTQSPDYRLDQEVQWTDLTHSLPNENLSIYGGTMGNEDLKVDVWNGTGWETVFADLTSGWNNMSITKWLTASTLTIRFSDGTKTGDSTPETWQIDIALIHIWNDNYTLDLEVQWINVDFSEANEQLCIYGGTMGSESLRVDVWTGSTWQNVIANLINGWNNVTVSAYLTSSTFTIRFKGSIETADTAQDSWAIDATLLHLWS
jgi:hypothetical protein